MGSDAEWAWLAGLFEGEGCITFTGKSSVALSLGMTDRDVVRRAQAVAGVGRFFEQERRPQYKPLLAWRVQVAAEVRYVLEQMRPWLGERRGERADEALARLANVRKPGHCKQDHPMEGDNIYTSPTGQRFCRTCLRARDRKRKRPPRGVNRRAET
jgi:hypothetical protein